MSMLIWKSIIAATYPGVWSADMRTHCRSGESLHQPEAYHSFLCQYVVLCVKGCMYAVCKHPHTHKCRLLFICTCVLLCLPITAMQFAHAAM